MAEEFEKNKEIQEDEISFKEFVLKIKDWWRYLWSKKWIILTTSIIGGILGFCYAYSKKPIYIATTTFVLESGEKSSGLGAYAGVASMMGIDLGAGGGGIFQGDNILELYKSRTMLKKTLLSPLDSGSKKTLIEQYIDLNNLNEGWKERSIFNESKFSRIDEKNNVVNRDLSRFRDSVVSKIVDNILNTSLNVVKLDKKLSIIKVDVRSKNENFAKRFNEELVKNVNDFYIQTRTKKSLENVNILQHKTDSVRAVMNGAIYSAAAVADATPNLNPTRQTQRAAPLQRAQFSAETNKAVLSEMVKNLEMSKMTLMKETPLIQVIDEPVYPLYKERLGKINGFIIGAILAGFLTLFLIIVRHIFKGILN